MLTIIGPSKFVSRNWLEYIRTGSIFVISSRYMGLKWPLSQINELGVFERLESYGPAACSLVRSNICWKCCNVKPHLQAIRNFENIIFHSKLSNSKKSVVKYSFSKNSRICVTLSSPPHICNVRELSRNDFQIWLLSDFLWQLTLFCVQHFIQVLWRRVCIYCFHLGQLVYVIMSSTWQKWWY